MENNNAEFQVKKAKPKKHVRKSGLFNYLTSDNTWIEKARLHRKNITIKPSYLIIELDIANIPKIANMQPLTWHIRVDDSYERKKKFLSQWHHTVELLDSDGQTKVLHAYYHIGLFQYITIDGVEIVNAEIINTFNDHCIHARDIVLNLITILQDAQKKLEGDFTKVASELYDVKAIMNLKDERIEEILTQCRKLHASLLEIDEESSHAPLKFLENRANFIRTRREALAKGQDSKQDEEEINTKSASMPTAKKSASKKAHKTAAKPMVDDKTMQSINSRIANIKKALNSDIAKSILDAHKGINKIEKEILELYKEYSGSARKLDDIFIEITSCKSLPEIFKDLVAGQKFDAAIGLFNAGYGDCTVMFYGDLLASISNIRGMSDTQQQEYVNFCNFLYENSEHYRTSLSVALNTMLFYKIKNIDIGESFLLNLAMQDKNILFKMFFKQLNSTIIIAQSCAGRANDILSTLLVRKSDDVELIPFLLEQGYPSEHSTEQFDTALKDMLNKANKSYGFGSKIIWNGESDVRAFQQGMALHESRDVVAVPSVFYHACQGFSEAERDLAVTRDILVNLAKQSSPLYLILGLSALMCNVDRTFRIPCEGLPMFAFFINDSDRMTAANALSYITCGTTSIAMLMLVNDPIKFALFSDVIGIFGKKTDEMSDEQKVAVHINLLRMIESENLIKDSVRSYNKLFALHIASVIAASILPQTRSTYNILKQSANSCLAHMRGLKEQYAATAREKIVLCQSLLPYNLIDPWVESFEVLAADLERFDYWKSNPQINSTTPLHDHMKAKYQNLLELKKAKEEEEIAATLADDSKAEQKEKTGCYLS